MSPTALLLLILSAGDWEMIPPERSAWLMAPDAPPAIAKPAPARSGYPLHPQRWNINGVWGVSREYALAHLQGGEHAGKWDPAWLATLSRAELLSLHDDDHDRRVQWAHVRRPTTAPAPAITNQTVSRQAPAVQVQNTRGLFKRHARPGGSCPGGFCPVR